MEPVSGVQGGGSPTSVQVYPLAVQCVGCGESSRLGIGSLDSGKAIKIMSVH